MSRLVIIILFGALAAGCAGPSDWRGRYVALNGAEEPGTDCPEVLRIEDVARSGDHYELRGAITYGGKSTPLHLRTGEDDGLAAGALDLGPEAQVTLPGQGGAAPPFRLEDHLVQVQGPMRIELWQPDDDKDVEYYTLSITSQAPPLRTATVHLGRVEE